MVLFPIVSSEPSLIDIFFRLTSSLSCVETLEFLLKFILFVNNESIAYVTTRDVSFRPAPVDRLFVRSILPNRS